MLGNCIQGISELLNCKLDSLNLVMWNEKYYFLAIASDRAMIISERLERVEESLEFDKIKGIIVSTKSQTLFKIHATKVYEFNSLERFQIITVLRYCWKTDFMYKNFQFKDLPLYKEDFTSKQSHQMPQIPFVSYMKEQPCHKFKNYYFSMPQDFQETYQDGVYCHKDRPDVKIVVQITEVMPLALLSQVGERENLQFYAENFLQILIKGMDLKQQERFSKESGFTQDNQSETSEKEFQPQTQQELEYWIITSNNYKKRQNLCNDISEWNGWEIHARSQLQDLFIIIMRKKYIPPLLESYQEFLFVLYGEEQSTVEKVFLNDRDLLKQTLEKDLEEHAFRNLLRNCVDSLQNNFNIYQDQYLIFIRMCANTLLYNKATLTHIYNKFKIVPQYIMYSIKYLQALFQILVLVDRDRFDQLAINLKSQYYEIMNQNQEFLTEVLQQEDNPTLLLYLFEETSFVKDKGSNEQDRRNIWQRKLSRYIAQCVDGGLMQQHFNLKELVPILYLKSVSQDIKMVIYELFDYCLYIVPKEERYIFKPGNLMKKLEQLGLYKLDYNSDTVKTLIEANFFSQELLLNDRAQMYSQLILYFLQSTNIDLIISIIKSIINFQADIKHQSGLTDQMIQAFKPIANKLIILYGGSNKTIQTLSAVALFNMCTNSREFKYTVMQNDNAKILVTKLASKDTYLLNFTLKLIYSVMSITQNIEKLLSNNLTDYLYRILEGSKIQGCQYDAKCLICTCQVLQICLLSEVEMKSTDHLLKLLFNIVVYIADQYHLDQEESVLLKSETLLVMCKICQKSFEVKRKINQEFIPFLLKIMGNLNILAVQEKIITLLCILIKENKEWALQWIEAEPTLLETLRVYQINEVQSSHYLLSQINNVKEENKKMREAEQKQIKKRQSMESPAKVKQLIQGHQKQVSSIVSFKQAHSKQNSKDIPKGQEQNIK